MMNTPNRHMRYRRSVYRKKRIKLTVIVCVAVLAVAALLFVIIGNMMGNRVAERHESDTDTSAPDTEDTERRTVKKVDAVHVPLNEDGSMLSTRLSNASRNGYTDVCFSLDTADGALLYISEIATELGKQVNGAADMRTVRSVASLMEDRDLYSIGITHISDFLSDDDLVRSAAVGYNAARIAETLRGGIDDVLIYVGDIPTEQYSELIGLAEEIHRLSPEGVVGLSLPVSVLSASDNAELIDGLWTAFDYLAADLSVQTDTETDAAEQIGEELGGMLYYLLRYNIRVLLPTTADSAQAEEILSAARSSGAQSIMRMP